MAWCVYCAVPVLPVAEGARRTPCPARRGTCAACVSPVWQFTHCGLMRNSRMRGDHTERAAKPGVVGVGMRPQPSTIRDSLPASMHGVLLPWNQHSD